MAEALKTEAAVKETWDLYEKIREYRHPFERQWYLNLAFLVGKQYARWNTATQKLEDAVRAELQESSALPSGRKSHLVSNHVLRLFRQKLSDFMKMKPTPAVQPATEDEADIKAADLSQIVLLYLWRKLRAISTLKKLYLLKMTFGHGSLWPLWNKRAGKAIQNGGYTGDAEMPVLTPYETYWPRAKWNEEMDQVIIVQGKPIEEIEAQFGQKVGAEAEIVASPVEQQIRILLEDHDLTRTEDMARLLTCFKLPSTKYPKGLYRVTTKDKLLFEGELPPWYTDKEGQACLPVFKFDFFEIPLSIYSLSLIEPLISPQKEYNLKISRIADYSRRMSGKWLVPFGAGLKEPINDQSNQIIYYDPTAGATPVPSPVPGLPASIFTDLARIKTDMEDLAASHDVSHSRVPSGVKSGVAIQALQEQDESQMAPITLATEEQLARVCEVLLNIVQANYIEPRTLEVVGQEKKYRISDFTGDMISGKRDVVISLGSGFPYSKLARQQAVMEQLKMGIITVDEARERLEIVGRPEIPENVDLLQIKEENAQMLEGVLVEVHEYDNHLLHIRGHNQQRKDPDFIKNAPPEVQMVFEAHDQLHKMLASKELAAAGAGAGAAESTAGAQPAGGMTATGGGAP